MTHAVAVIGTGPGREVDISGRSHSWAYKHGDGYAARADCELVACADLGGEYAEAYADEFSIPDSGVYEDHETLLAEESVDVVSVCTPIPAHAPIVLDAAATGGVEAIHCEKPMADGWGAARAMYHVCEDRDVRLTFGHQRRFAEPFRQAKALLDGGAVGDLERIEISWGNFFDNGTHTVDLAGMFVDEARAEWVIGQTDYSKEHVRYGMHTADHALVAWEYETGVHAVCATGDGVGLTGGPFDFYDCFHRLVGTDGVIEVGRHEGPPLRVRQDGEGWWTVDVDDEFLGSVAAGVDDVIEASNAGRESELRAANALNTAEILFAGHESARRRGRVELPLATYDHALQTMVEEGTLVPREGDDRPLHPAEQE
jgi:predicted dehydrogenase